jgi:hypothetical protein
MHSRIQTPPRVGQILVEAIVELVSSPTRLHLGFNRLTYKEKSNSASCKVVRPSSIGSMSGPRSSFALTGTKKDLAIGKSSLGLLCGLRDDCDTDEVDNLGASRHSAGENWRSEALARSCNGFSASSKARLSPAVAPCGGDLVRDRSESSDVSSISLRAECPCVLLRRSCRSEISFRAAASVLGRLIASSIWCNALSSPLRLLQADVSMYDCNRNRDRVR